MSRSRVIAILGFLLALAAPTLGSASDSEQIRTFTCRQSGQVERLSLLRDGGLLVALDTDEEGVLEIEELGQAVALRTTSPIFEVTVPLRYSRRFVEFRAGASSISIERQQANHAIGAVAVSMHCLGAQEPDLHADWLRRASQIASRLNRPVEPDELGAIGREIEVLDRGAPGTEYHALCKHLHAQALFVNERSSAAVVAFAEAEKAWIAAGDTSRALVARVGWIEDLVRTAQFESVAKLIAAPQDKQDKSPSQYFAVRLQNARCVALDNLGRLSEAEKCYQWTTRELEALDERTEYVNALRNFAILQHKMGQSEKARDNSRRVLGLASGPSASMVRGRVHLTLADIALSQGDVIGALVEYNSASGEFLSADSQRWQANSMLGTAQIYRELGASTEAYAALADAVQHLSARDAPTRLADAMTLFSILERDSQFPLLAQWWARAAEHVYSNHGMTEQAGLSRIRRLEQEVQDGEYREAEDALLGETQLPVHSSVELRFLAANLALKTKRTRAAGESLDWLRHRVSSMRDQIRFAQLEGEYWNLIGNSRQAQRTLWELATRMNSLAQAVRSSVVRYMIERQTLLLRRTAFHLTLQQSVAARDSATIEALLGWLLTSGIKESKYERNDRSEKFDQATAALLLAPLGNPAAGANPATERELLSLLAQATKRNAATGLAIQSPLESLRRVLPGDSAFVAYIDGGTNGGLLWVTRDHAALLDAAPPDRTRASITSLRELVRSPNSPITQIQLPAQLLSQQLFGEMPAGRPPKHLYVLAEEPLNGVPWGALTWPDESSPLLDTTAIELVRPGSGQSNESIGGLVQVIVAAQGGSSVLPALAGADAEAVAIRNATGSIQVRTPAASRASVLSALLVPRGWVHIAAHGVAEPQRIGYSGIWLDPATDGKTPAFLSWIDILDSGVHSDLVVLNACQLGDSGTATNRNLSFADAVSRAGAKQVVATLWPVSDAAAALWVPEFYSTMTADTRHDAAQALRAAQLRLRESRAFRHPFFWAGMQVIERLPIVSEGPPR